MAAVASRLNIERVEGKAEFRTGAHDGFKEPIGLGDGDEAGLQCGVVKDQLAKGAEAGCAEGLGAFRNDLLRGAIEHGDGPIVDDGVDDQEQAIDSAAVDEAAGLAERDVPGLASVGCEGHVCDDELDCGGGCDRDVDAQVMVCDAEVGGAEAAQAGAGVETHKANGFLFAQECVDCGFEVRALRQQGCIAELVCGAPGSEIVDGAGF